MRSSLAALLAASLSLSAPAFTVQTSLYDMVGLDDAGSVAELRSGTEREVVVLCDGPEPAKSRQAVQDFIAALPAEYVASPQASGPTGLAALANRVCDEDAALLKTPEGRAKIAKRAIRRYVASPVPPLVGPAEDPFCLKERFLMSCAADGCAVASFSLPDEIVGDLDRLVMAIAVIRARAAAGPSRLMITGVPVHTALTAAECRRQVVWLTWFSFVFIALLSIFVFRSLKWIPLLALSLAVACGAGGLAILIGFESVHVMTFVFGTTVLGLVIDYSFHWLLSPKRDAALRRNLLVSWLTTEISLLPLMLSSLPVLRQAAVFLAAALAAALAFVLLVYPRRPRGMAALALAFGTLAVVTVGCGRVRTDPKAIYNAPAELAEADRVLAAKWTVTEDPAAEIEKLYAEQGGKVAEALGIGGLRFERAAAKSPRGLLEAMLNALTSETLARLAMSVVCLFLALVGFFRRRALRLFAPSGIAIGLVFAAVLLTNGSVNLFHLLAMFLLAGMSVDYTVFLHNGGRESVKPAVCSLLTSMAGFGALSFVSFPVVSAFGIVLGAGLPVAFLSAFVLRPRADVGVEVAATPLGMELLFLVYRVFGLGFLRFWAAAVGVAVWLFSARVRKASPRLRKTVLFTRSLADKLVVMAEGRRLPAVTFDGSADAREFIRSVEAREGVFVLSSHVGTIEVLAAAAANPPRFHAWMDFDRTSAFNAFYLGHARRRQTVIHPVAEIGMATAFSAGEWLEAGECLVMAGDRGDGAFRFARAMAHPVYFAACVAVGGGYRAIVRRLPDEVAEMKRRYFEVRGAVAAEYPDQDFEWGNSR